MLDMGRAATLLHVVLAMFVATAGWPQTHLIRHYSEDDGLPSSTIYDIAQDPSGRMWFATRSGVAVYDGVAFQTVNDGLPALAVDRLAFDEGGRLWSMIRHHPRAVSYWDGRVWTPLPAVDPHRGGPARITSFAVAWSAETAVPALGTLDGLHLWDGAGWRPVEDLPSPRVHALAARGNALFVGGAAGLTVVDVADRRATRLPLDSPEMAIVALADERLGLDRFRLWLLGTSWLGSVQGGRLELLARDLSLANPGDDLPRIAPAWRDLLMVATRGSIYEIGTRDGSIARSGYRDSLGDAGALALFSDREGLLWLGTQRGVTKVVSRRFANFGRLQGLLEDEVTAILGLEPDLLLLGHNSGFSIFEPQGGDVERRPFPAELGYVPGEVRVMDLAQDARGDVWAALGRAGVMRWRRSSAPASGGAAPVDWLSGDAGLRGSISSLVVDERGGLWAAGEAGVFRRRNGRFDAVSAELPPGLHVRRMTLGPEGEIYLATAGHGLQIWHRGNWSAATASTPEGDSLYTVLTDSRGQVWAGAQDGIYRLDGDRLRRVLDGELATPRPVYLLVEDRDQRLWVGTDNGVLRRDGRRVRSFGVREGLAGRETNRAAGWTDLAGRVWIGTNQGLSRYDERFDREPPPPEVDLVEVEVGGERRPLDRPIELEHDENHPVFHARALSFIDEKRLEMAHRLEGFDPGWRPPVRAASRRIRYTHLPAGRYRLLVRARRAGGAWSPVEASAQIVIRQPFWRADWFLVTSAVAVALGMVGGLRFFETQRTARRLERLVRERTLEVEQKNDELEISFWQLNQSREQLEIELEKHEKTAAELRRARDAAVASSRAKSTLLALLSHEIRTPLSGLIEVTSQLEESTSSRDQGRRLRSVRASGERLLAILDDILDEALIEAGQQQLADAPFAPRTVLREATERFADPAVERRLELEHRAAAEVPDRVRGDASRVRRALENLVGAAVAGAGEGQVSVLLDTGARPPAGAPDATADAEGVVLHFTVRATGLSTTACEGALGLDPEESSHPPSLSGLSLMVCRRLVERLGGRIWVVGEAQGGTRISFTVPARRGPPSVPSSVHHGEAIAR